MPLPGAGCPFLTDWREKLNGINPAIVCRIGTVRTRDRTTPEDECERSASSGVTEAMTQKKWRPVAGPPSSQAGLENCQARRAIMLPRRKAAPVSAKPPIIMAQLAGSGTGVILKFETSIASIACALAKRAVRMNSPGSAWK
jgi:hypothetical protein